MNSRSEENSMEASSEKVVVYLHGFEGRMELWYRVEFEAAFPITKELLGQERILREPGMKISPVGSLDRESVGYGGRWTAVGDYIYWIGGFKCVRGGRLSLWEHLLERKMNHPYPLLWEFKSSSMNIPRISPFVASLTGPKKHQLCVVGGTQHCPAPADDDRWSKCGEIYDLDNNTWTILDTDFNLVCSYNTFYQATLVQNGEEPSEVVFYSLADGSTLFLDLSTGAAASHAPVKHAHFDLWGIDLEETPPEYPNLDCLDFHLLRFVTKHVQAVFSNNTFYWFTSDLRLFGYNIKDQRWLRSRPLQEELTLNPEETRIPILLGLGNKKFVVIVAGKDRGNLTMASFTVARVEDSLTVSVGSVLPLSFDEISFMPYDGKAMFKKAG